MGFVFGWLFDPAEADAASHAPIRSEQPLNLLPLDGTRLKGRWHLVRMRPRSGEKTEPWLLIKSDDEFGRHIGDRGITDEEATSHISGRTNEELAATGEIRKDHAARLRATKARKASYRTSASFPALARACSQFSSSRASQPHVKSR